MDSESAEGNLGKASLGLLVFAVFMDLFGFGIIIPILPGLVTDTFGGTGLDYGLIISLFSLMQFIFAPLWGKLSDTMGRRPIILIGLLGSVLGFSIFGLATNLWMIYIARSIAGIFTAATLTVANAYIADTTPPEKRGQAYGYIIAAFGLGFAIGPGVGGYLSDKVIFGIGGHELNGFFAAGLCLINFIGALLVLPESLDEETKQINLNKEKTPMFSPKEFSRVTQGTEAPTYVMIFALTSFGFSMLIAAFAIYAPKVDETVDERALGIYFTYSGFVLLFTQQILTNPLLKRFGEVNVTKIGLIGLFIGYLTLPFAHTFAWMFVTNTFLLIGVALSNPAINSSISKLTSKENQGIVMGFNQSFASLMRVVGPLLAGVMFDINILYPFYAGTIIFFVIIVYAQWKLKIKDVLMISSPDIMPFTAE